MYDMTLPSFLKRRTDASSGMFVNSDVYMLSTGTSYDQDQGASACSCKEIHQSPPLSIQLSHYLAASGYSFPITKPAEPLPRVYPYRNEDSFTFLLL